MLSEEILKKHIKIQREECIKHEANSEEFRHHWELMNLLCEIGSLRESHENLFLLLMEEGIIMKKD